MIPVGLSLVRLGPIKDKASGERATELPQPFDRQLSTPVSAAVKLAKTSDPYFNLITRFRVQRFEYICRCPEGEAAASLRGVPAGGETHSVLNRLAVRI
jgi:hypothetical protein